VGQWTNFTIPDLRDGIHASDSGDVKMSDRSYPALVNAIHSIQGDETARRVQTDMLP
jgi:hypothetical protein